jgi:hypothetical protein
MYRLKEDTIDYVLFRIRELTGTDLKRIKKKLDLIYLDSMIVNCDNFFLVKNYKEDKRLAISQQISIY